MGCIDYGGLVIMGNFAKLLKERPKNFNWAEDEDKWLRPYFLKWREKIGKVKCDCVEVEEHYMPYYGFTFYHNKDCALMKQLRDKPHLKNLWCYHHLPALPIDYDA